MADDWLEDDLEEMQPKKKRKLREAQNGIRGEDSALSSTARGKSRTLGSDSVCRRSDYAFVQILHIYLFVSPSFLPSLAFRWCSPLLRQQGSLSEKEQLCEASSGQNDSDAWDGEDRKTRGQPLTQPHNYRR